VYVECFGLEGGETIGGRGQSLADGLQIVEGFLESEIFEVIAERFQAEKSGELLIHAEHCILAAGPEDMMAVFQHLEYALQLATQLLIDTKPEDFGDLVRQHA